MSADSYAVCPRCAAKDPFIDRMNENQRTLREYYEFYLTPSGEFTADYSGQCDECDFKFSFHFKQQVEIG